MKKTLKRSLSFLLAITIIFSSMYVGLSEVDFSGLFVVKAKAASSGTCGSKLTWTLNDSGLLTISGTGDMTDYFWSSSNCPWYSVSSNITSIVINDDVTSIGAYAFSECKNLTSVIIGSGVTKIGYAAFSNCIRLGSVKIPANVNAIWYGAFSGCFSIKEISVDKENLYYASSDGVLFDKNYTTLIQYPAAKINTSITIPDSVTSIADFAFCYSTNLTSVILSDNIKKIGQLAFGGCVNLTSIKIPNGVTNINDYTFAHCSNLESITIPDSVTNIGSDAFYGCESLETVYYSGSEEEWNGIIVNSGNTSLTNANIILNCKINDVSLRNANLALVFKDLNNDTVFNNETIFINGTEYDTGNGTIIFSKSDLQETNTISVISTASDYYEETFKLEYLDDSSETIYLEKKKSDKKPYINYVYYKNITSSSNWKNAAGEKITIPNTSEEYFKIAVGATAQTGEIASICLAQDGLNTLESSDGIFTNKQLAKEFDPDKDIIAYCIDTNGNVSPAFRTEIEIENVDKNITTVLNDGKIELFSTSGTSFEISDDVPFLGGTEIGLDFASLPISVSVDGSKYKVAVGIDNKTFTADEWNVYKKGLDEIKNMRLNKSASDSEVANDRQRYKKMQELRKSYGAKVVKGKAIGNGSFNWNVLGYVEWEVVNGSVVLTDSYIGLAADAGYSWQSPYVVLGVPCYTEIGVGVSASVGGSVSRIIADSDIPIEWDIKLSVKPSLSLGAGVGCPSFLSLGVEGKGEIEWYQEFLNKYREIDLTLSASLKAKAFLLSFDKKFATKTWNLWSGTYGSASQNTLSDSVDPDYSSGSVNFLDANNYNALADRNYVNQTEWIGGYTPTLFSSRAISVSGYENSLLQTSIYSDSRQQLVEFDGGKMLVWVMDDTTRESANRTELVYSLYDEVTSTWSEPVAVYDDGTADFLPDVVSDGTDVWVTWQNMNTTFTKDTATMENYSSAAEIYVARYNGEKGEFETAIQLTDDALVDSIPTITADNGSVSVVWISNSACDYFGVEGVNSIKTAAISNDKLGDTETVKTDLTSVSSIDCKLSDNELYIAYAYDLDNDYNDMSDMEIYQLQVSGGNITETRLTENTVLDSAPRYSNLGSKLALVWYSEGNFNVLTLDSNEVSTVFAENVGATDIYSVAQSAGDITYIIWSQSVGEQVAFYGAVYDGSEWGEPVLLGETTGKALNPSAIVDADGTMFVAYNNVVQEQVTETLEDTGEEFTYYTDVQTDLALLKIYQNSNITLSDDGLEIDAESAFPGETIPLTFNVENNGTTSVDSIDVYIDGQLNSTVQVDLLPGNETSVTIDYTVPEIVVETTLSITAEPSGSTDYDATDNKISITYGYTELDVENVTVYSTALKNTITARICNTSAVDSGKFTVRIREDDENGIIICSENYDNLAVGEALFITQEFDKSSLVYDEDGVSKYYVEIVADSTEYLTGNNSGFAVFTEENNTGITSEMLRKVVNDGFVHAYGVIQNNEFAEHEVYAKIEILDEAGNVIGLKFKKVSLTDKQIYTLDENVHISGEYYETRLTLLDVETCDISLRIPKGVTTIDELDFENCSDVVKLIIPESVKSIGTDALSGCDNLTVYCFPNSEAHTYCEENTIPYVLYQMSPVGETTIDSTQKYIFTDKLGCDSLESIVNITGYNFVATPISEMLLFGTGSTIEVFEEEEPLDNYTLVVEGDVNGDSVCDALDAWQVSLASNGHETLNGAYALAADSNSDDIVDINDYQSIVNRVVA